jgi:hypothetical protein
MKEQLHDGGMHRAAGARHPLHTARRMKVEVLFDREPKDADAIKSFSAPAMFRIVSLPRLDTTSITAKIGGVRVRVGSGRSICMHACVKIASRETRDHRTEERSASVDAWLMIDRLDFLVYLEYSSEKRSQRINALN